MRMISYCQECQSIDIEVAKDTDGKWIDGMCYCNNCKKITIEGIKYVESPYERTRNAVYATENRWAIENFNATH